MLVTTISLPLQTPTASLTHFLFNMVQRSRQALRHGVPIVQVEAPTTTFMRCPLQPRQVLGQSGMNNHQVQVNNLLPITTMVHRGRSIHLLHKVSILTIGSMELQQTLLLMPGLWESTFLAITKHLPIAGIIAHTHGVLSPVIIQLLAVIQMSCMVLRLTAQAMSMLSVSTGLPGAVINPYLRSGTGQSLP